jgi:hypothetical protein
MSQSLLITLDANATASLRNKHVLWETCLEYLCQSIKSRKLCYRGIKLDCLFKNLKSM